MECRGIIECFKLDRSSKYRWLLGAGIKDEERNDSQMEYSALIHLEGTRVCLLY